MSKVNKFAELKRRIWFLIGALIVFRIGAHIPVPGIDPIVLAKPGTIDKLLQEIMAPPPVTPPAPPVSLEEAGD